MKYTKWLEKQNFNAKSKTIIVTGANSGIGYYSSLYFAHLGANVIMACRNVDKANSAKEKILKDIPTASINIEIVDLSSKTSISSFAKEIKQKYATIDILVNNAGVYMPSQEKTADGYNMTIGTNFLGTCFLTECLKPMFKNNGRIVFVTSLTDIFSKLNSHDPLGNNSKSKNSDYGKSKLYISCYAHTLSSDSLIKSKNITIATTHPGIAATNLLSTSKTSFSKAFAWAGYHFLKIFMHSAEKASLGIVFASLKDSLSTNPRIAPRGLFGISGYPKIKKTPRKIKKQAGFIIKTLLPNINSSN